VVDLIDVIAVVDLIGAIDVVDVIDVIDAREHIFCSTVEHTHLIIISKLDNFQNSSMTGYDVTHWEFHICYVPQTTIKLRCTTFDWGC